MKQSKQSKQSARSWWTAGGGMGSQPGAALIEVGLGLPFLIAIAVGLVAVGGIISLRLPLASLARETARVMAEAPSYSLAQARGQHRFAQVSAGLELSPERLESPSVVVRDALDQPVGGDSWPRGGTVEVTIRYHHQLAHWPWLGLTDPILVETARYPIQRYASR